MNISPINTNNYNTNFKKTPGPNFGKLIVEQPIDGKIFDDLIYKCDDFKNLVIHMDKDGYDTKLYHNKAKDTVLGGKCYSLYALPKKDNKTKLEGEGDIEYGDFYTHSSSKSHPITEQATQAYNKWVDFVKEQEPIQEQTTMFNRILNLED